MKSKFLFTLMFGCLWLFVSAIFGIWWAEDVSNYLPAGYVWFVIIGIALFPGFLMSSMFFSNLMHIGVKKYEKTDEDTTVIMCAHNEEETIIETIESIYRQKYGGHIHLLIIDNCSTDGTEIKVKEYAERYANKEKLKNNSKFSIEYVYCGIPGKANALNCGLKLVETNHFITVDADTFLERNAVQNIMNHIVTKKSACVAGNLFVKNVKSSIFTKMQNYDYLISIAAIKRFQGSYNSTLVAQGAFSAYQTNAIRKIGGWKDCLGEDIVLTYQLLEQNESSTYEPTAVGYTVVPTSLNSLYNQRKRWAIGMLEGFSAVKPWNQGSFYSKYFTIINVLIMYLDVAYLFGFIPGVFLALFGYYYFVGYLTIVALMVSIILYLSVYYFQKKLNIPFENSFIGFIFFLIFFQVIQSSAALHGYVTRLLKGKEVWKWEYETNGLHLYFGL